MKIIASHLLALFTCAFILSCNQSCKSASSDNQEGNENNTSGSYKITVNFQYGESLSPTAYKNIYVIWIENQDSAFLQNISVCKKLVSGSLTGTALPYWKLNKYPNSLKSEVDAVTSATKANCDFSVSAVVRNKNLKKFTLCFEIDRSYEPNDWFSDQPALLYSVVIDLNSDVKEYELKPAGWTPNEYTENIISGTPKGVLQTEIRYITNLKDGNSFGGTDSRSATRMVKKITATIE